VNCDEIAGDKTKTTCAWKFWH